MVYVLHISLDEILLPQQIQESSEFQEVLALLGQCSKSELSIVSDLVRSLIKIGTKENRAERRVLPFSAIL